jgi:hypothetical protein
LSRRPGAALAVLGVQLLAAAVWALPVLVHLGTHALGVLGDPDEYTWFLGWFRYALASHTNPLLSDFLNHPAGINLMWNTSDPLIAAAAAPLTAAVGPIAAYNLLVPLAMALSGWCAYLAARRFGAGVLGSAFAGLLYEFSPYLVAQSRAHLSTVLVCFAPLLVILLDEALGRQRWPALWVGAGFGVVLALQLLVLEEYVATAALVALVALAATVAVVRRWKRSQVLYLVRAAAASAFAFVVVAGWPLYVQFRGPHRPGTGTVFHEPNRFVTDLLNVVLPTPAEAFVPPGATSALGRLTGTFYENGGYLGPPLLLACALVIVLGWRDRRLRVLALAAGALLVLSFGGRLHVHGVETGIRLPGALWNRVPLLQDGLPARLSLYVALAAALLAAVFVDRWVVHGSRRTRALALTLTALIVLTWLPSPPPSFPQPVPAYFAGAGVRALPAGDVVLLTPWPREGVEQGMVWQAAAGMRFRLVGGYFLFADARGKEYVGSPPTPLQTAVVGIETGARSGDLAAGEGAGLLAELHADGVDHVLVTDGTEHADQMTRFFSALLGGAPTRAEGVNIWRVS